MLVARLKQIFMAAALSLGVLASPVQAGTHNLSRQALSCDSTTEVKAGEASWYGPGFHGRKTANGEKFNMYAMTAAHKTLKLGTRIKVTNEDNGEELIVRVNDRGPYVKGRILDLSRGAAAKLGFEDQGVIHVAYRVCPEV
ncbi:MAG: hypothetical protein JWO78_1048 [Micavibrio sp.]|nr:hypothetical protein [Micavibrio sp.]